MVSMAITTMMARIIANVLYKVGVIKTNKLVETDRAGLVGEHVGETAQKTTKVVSYKKVFYIYNYVFGTFSKGFLEIEGNKDYVMSFKFSYNFENTGEVLLQHPILDLLKNS